MQSFTAPQSEIHPRTGLANIPDFVDATISGWPDAVPLLALCSGAGQSPWSRWTILAQPRTIIRHQNKETRVEPLASGDVSGGDYQAVELGRFSNDPMADLAQILDYLSTNPDTAKINQRVERRWKKFRENYV